MSISVSIKSISQKTKSTKTKTAVNICKIYTHKIKIRQTTITQSPGMYIFTTHLQDTINQEVINSWWKKKDSNRRAY